MSVPITPGSGATSVAAELIGSLQYQQIKVVDGTASSTNKWVINNDGSAQVSVVGTVSMAGSVIAVVTGTPSISGAVELVGNSASIITVFKSSSLIGVVTGSVVAIPTGNQSVSGTVGSSIIGWAPIQTSNTSVIAYVQNSIAAVIIGGSIAATITPAANQSVSGTVGSSIIGWAPIQPSNTSTIGIFQNSSILAVPVGSTIAVLQSSSILAVPVGSVITVLQAPSIVGTYAEDSAHTSGDKGVFALQVRNDTMSSITSADGDYSPQAVGPVGEVVVSNAPITKWINGVADLRVVLGTSVAALAAQGASIFTYVTGVQVANFGPSSVLVKFSGGLGSVLAWTIAPAGGGSNIYYQNGLRTGENSAFTASISGTASVIVSAQGFISKT